jgi:hypothetical protein
MTTAKIEPAELFRVFPATGETPPKERDATADVLVAELRAVIADLRRGQEDLRQERDRWRAAHEREQAVHAATQRLLLPPPATALERDATSAGEGRAPDETPRNRLVRAWRWMRATGCLAGAALLLVLTTSGAGAQQQQDTSSANFMLPHCKLAILDKPGRGTFTEGLCAGSITSLVFFGRSLSGSL